MGNVAADGPTLDEAELYATRWLTDATSIPSDVAAVAVPLASIRQGAARLFELRAAARTARIPQDRNLAIRSMGMFEDPAILRAALDLTLTDEIKVSEMGYVFGPAGSRRAGREVLYAWEKENWTALLVRLPGSLSHGLAGAAASACTSGARDDAKTFFTAAMASIEGAKRPLAEALEWADLCVALHEHGAASVTTWLRAWRAGHPG